MRCVPQCWARVWVENTNVLVIWEMDLGSVNVGITNVLGFCVMDWLWLITTSLLLFSSFVSTMCLCLFHGVHDLLPLSFKLVLCGVFGYLFVSVNFV